MAEEIKDIPVITDGDLSDIRILLKTYIPNWAVDVAAVINKNEEWKKAGLKICTSNTVYNISNGKIKSQFRRRIFDKSAFVLLRPILKNTK